MDTDESEKQNRGQQIRQLFDQCTNLNHQQKIELIAKSEFPNNVKEHVSKLLRFTGSEIQLTQSVIDTVQVSLDIKPLKPQMKIGAYELIKPIGEGGQAEVWMAERIDGGFKHQVAIKFLKPLHGQNDRARFHSERELLATLKHANIAQLLDGGELGENRPYMVLEYIEGLPLLEYGQLKNFTLKQYLDCFLQICDAVSYAHSHSIIHRDIKPSNIYITLEGAVKLLDFGIAKFLSNESLSTQTLPVMTLAYSSPEQVTGDPVSTATDVYTLGLLLYEMLTGVRAQAVKSKVPADIIKEITQKSPIPPSEVAQRFNFDRPYRARDLEEDLDNLISMAIRKEPQRRYPNVKALASDVNNFLEGKPLVAAGDSWTYLSKKFFTRNPVVSLTFLALMAFMIALPVIQYKNQLELEQERDRTMLASIKAEEQSIIAQKTMDFWVNVLESSSPYPNNNKDINLSEILDSAGKQLTHGLDNQPHVKAHLLLKIAGIHKHLGRHDMALQLFAQALSIFEKTNDIDGQVISLGQMAVVSSWSNNPDRTKQIITQLEPLSLQLSNPVQQTWHIIRMVEANRNMGQTENSLKQLTASLDTLKSLKVKNHKLLSRLYHDLSAATNDNHQALEFLDKALEHAQKDIGTNSMPYFTSLLSKANRLSQDKQYEAADAVFQQVLDLTDKLHSKNHSGYAELLSGKALVSHKLGKYEQARSYYEEAIGVIKTINKTNTPDYVLLLSNFALLMEELGHFDAAEALLNELLFTSKKLTVDPNQLVEGKLILARILSKTGNYQGSQVLIREILSETQSTVQNNVGLKLTHWSNHLGDYPDKKSCQQFQLDMMEHTSQFSLVESIDSQKNQQKAWLEELTKRCLDTKTAQEPLNTPQNNLSSLNNEEQVEHKFTGYK